jgi:hypothetical protein
VLGLEAALAFGVGAMLFDEAATWRTLIAVTLIVLGIALFDGRLTRRRAGAEAVGLVPSRVAGAVPRSYASGEVRQYG